MQLDRTSIAIHERSILDILDLALHVARAYLVPVMVTLVVGILPLAILNQWLLGWMIGTEILTQEDVANAFRYCFDMSLLVYFEAPLASAFTTLFLGQAVFQDRPRIPDAIRAVLRLGPRLLVCQFLLRGVGLAWLLAWGIDRSLPFSPQEALLILLTLALSFWRGLRPFINEIVLLERNPLVARDPKAMTVRRRSGLLHNPRGGDLFLRWLGISVVAGCLLFATFGLSVFLKSLVTSSWQFGPGMLEVALPACLWLVAGYLTVVRFLNYLDLRIRQEGWEVELRMRAEAARMAHRIT